MAQLRKPRSKNGEASSKMMSFRIDAENVAYLATVANKSLLVNFLISAHAASVRENEK